jgi:4-hydroxy-2-oxoglutarate aldolase
MIIAPAYFAAQWGKNPDAVKAFFTEVADKSPLPVIIYNVSLSRRGFPTLGYL